MELCPITLREANDFVESYHRHNNRTSRDGGKFAIGLTDGEELVGVAIVGLPLARMLANGFTAEVLRTCTSPKAGKGAVSKLYAACWRAWRAMGGRRLITYTLATESGDSLRGAGWRVVGETKPGDWNRGNRSRSWQPIYGQKKIRWAVSTEEKK